MFRFTSPRPALAATNLCAGAYLAVSRFAWRAPCSGSPSAGMADKLPPSSSSSFSSVLSAPSSAGACTEAATPRAIASSPANACCRPPIRRPRAISFSGQAEASDDPSPDPRGRSSPWEAASPCASSTPMSHANASLEHDEGEALVSAASAPADVQVAARRGPAASDGRARQRMPASCSVPSASAEDTAEGGHARRGVPPPKADAGSSSRTGSRSCSHCASNGSVGDWCAQCPPQSGRTFASRVASGRAPRSPGLIHLADNASPVRACACGSVLRARSPARTLKEAPAETLHFASSVDALSDVLPGNDTVARLPAWKGEGCASPMPMPHSFPCSAPDAVKRPPVHPHKYFVSGERHPQGAAQPLLPPAPPLLLSVQSQGVARRRSLEDAGSADCPWAAANCCSYSQAAKSPVQPTHARRVVVPHECAPPERQRSFQAFLGPKGTYNVLHRWRYTHGYLDLILNDRFHAILAMKWAYLVILVFAVVFGWAVVLAVILAVITEGDVQRCLGPDAQDVLDFYFFVVETMFAIGYGSPRAPTCRASSFFVTPTVVSGILLNSVILGVVFQKFSAASKRKWALAFSNCLVGRMSPLPHQHGPASTLVTDDRLASREILYGSFHGSALPAEGGKGSDTGGGDEESGPSRRVDSQTQGTAIAVNGEPCARSPRCGRNTRDPILAGESDADQLREKQQPEGANGGNSSCISVPCRLIMETAGQQGRRNSTQKEEAGRRPWTLLRGARGSVQGEEDRMLAEGRAEAEREGPSLATPLQDSPKPEANPSREASEQYETEEHVASEAQSTSDQSEAVHTYTRHETDRDMSLSASGWARRRASRHTAQPAQTASLGSRAPGGPRDDKAHAAAREGERLPTSSSSKALAKECSLSARPLCVSLGRLLFPAWKHYRLSFRVINVTHHSFFNPKLCLYLLKHSDRGLRIRQFPTYRTDTPLEFLEMPITVTVDTRDRDSPLREVTAGELQTEGGAYEILSLLSFTDNHTSRPVEIRKSWSLQSINWGEVFSPIVRPPYSTITSSGGYEVYVDSLSSTEVSAFVFISYSARETDQKF
ncbi:hypothetical protein BESB_068240 [Besnoitia besnoiti]|uniref:Inward rectifier potassium channel protein n=1 Tax=Besnoitia besnoiti TaxID=94643 RepID=A0A2A9MEV1_BESBE|nr:hypothetical protein BESB_068240 [Besnoitia besnoiti]PFH34791.1 hypothetical protein BESB_068240 [Besnoitia besnoiti]